MSWPFVGFLLIGVVVGGFGTLIGAGGGFLLLPLLVFLYPHDRADVLTAISLTVAFVNALSGSFAYARMRRIDVRAGLIFAAAGVPGAIAGARVTSLLDRRSFDPLLGAMLVLAGAVLFVQSSRATPPETSTGTRTLIETDGTRHSYTPRIALGAVLSLGVGFLSSLLGIGGGIVHVPLMAYALGFPVHVATATSHFVLAIVVLAGVLVHAGNGSLGPAVGRIVPLAIGAFAGAQGGARLSSRVPGTWIVRALALALASVGLRLLVFR